jgi:monofunctional glycosyltransferase
MKRRLLRAAAIAAAVAFALVAYVYLTLPDVRILGYSNPTTTAFMELRQREAEREGRTLRHVHKWLPYTRISKNLQRAVLVAEDSRFWEHEGIDLEEIRKSIEINMERGAAIRGASTITQQLAKNLYLSPSKDPFRKVRELIIARRMEAALPKARILEIYLNVIEWGDGIWGAEAAARTYFGVSAASVSREQAALLAGASINPRTLNPARPNRRLLQRQRIILGRMGSVEPPAPQPMPEAPAEALPDSAAPPVEEVPGPSGGLPAEVPSEGLPPDPITDPAPDSTVPPPQ